MVFDNKTGSFSRKQTASHQGLLLTQTKGQVALLVVFIVFCNGVLSSDAVNACTHIKCLNGGTCEAKGHSYTCICKEAYYGSKCEICGGTFKMKPGVFIGRGRHIKSHTLDECKMTCVYDLRCSSVSYAARKHLCMVYQGVSARRNINRQPGFVTFELKRCPVCQEIEDPCNSTDACNNGGICHAHGRAFSCSCSNDYIGDTCQSYRRNILMYTTNCVLGFPVVSNRIWAG